MNANMAYQTYQQSQTHECMEPAQLTLLLYKEAIRRLNLTKSALLEKDIPKRGENLGRAIAIISELNACIPGDNQPDEILFLKGLYTSILMELPKVNITKNPATLDTALKYIQRLKDIWENDVMGGGQPKKKIALVKNIEYA
ncbi:FliS [Desulforapulum autotrophicum HRM2]|uniref:FliS n=1 Tax=Desulforapulum autotrophicum (strain ATCC 43914 / DSM 3382 / VKM B-1955 / HRM2) TaxID=177437 RepID=C0QA30_DESAH|nr:flagellar export chaperone FliS [Desulforapulum autotrophicum]ACN16748.1 FliS [Desulforapulum autotrophicum HRM2]